VVDTIGQDLAEYPAEPSRLSVELRVAGSTCVLKLFGALKGTTAAALEAQIDQLNCTACLDVNVDLAQVTEIDAIGAGVLSGLEYQVRSRGGRLTMIGATARVASALAHSPGGADGAAAPLGSAPVPGATLPNPSATSLRPTKERT
jgi:anti-anti-sigma factor